MDDLPGDTRLYLSWQEQHDKLREALASLRSSARSAQAPVKIAMQYSPMNAIPYISRVDAGTIELVRSFSVEVVTSADLVQRFEAIWDADQYKSHCYAAAALREIVDETFAHIRKAIRNDDNLSEYSLQQFILSQIASRGMHTYAPPIVAVNAHCADPLEGRVQRSPSRGFGAHRSLGKTDGPQQRVWRHHLDRFYRREGAAASI